MLRSTAKATILFSWVTGVLTQGLATCNGFEEPDWDDCDVFADYVKNNIGEVPLQGFPACSVIIPTAKGWNQDDHNCEVMVCPLKADVHVLWGELRIGQSTVKAVCEAYGSGGQDVWDDDFAIQVAANPTYKPSAARTADETPADETTDRQHSRDFAAKRQEPDDDGFNLLVRMDRIEKPGVEFAIKGGLPAGGSHEIRESESVSSGISTSMEMGASFFEIFTASVGVEISQEQTSTISVGTTIYVDCEPGQTGVIYWKPLFTLYQGQWTPSGNYVDIWVPDDSEVGTSNFGVRCQR